MQRKPEGFTSTYPDIKTKAPLSKCAVKTAEKLQNHHLTTAFKGCLNCSKLEREQAEAEKKQKAEEIRQERKRLALDKETARSIKAESFHPCPVCGEPTNGFKVYCSERCRNKAHNSTKEVRRRKKIRTVTIDKDITVAGLFKRDGGVCYLCGNPCNLEDYTVRDGTIIAGDWYPSIDHVVPLIQGGVHAWDNVKLAHRRCNSLKGGKTIDAIPPLYQK